MSVSHLTAVACLEPGSDMNNNRKTLFSVPVDVYQPKEFISMIEKALKTPGVKMLFAINPEKIMRAQKDPRLLSALQESNFLIPDGIGTVIGLKLSYGEGALRTTGIGLMQSLLKLAAEKKFKIFIFGAKPASNRLAAENILKQYPSLKLVGTQHGYIPAEKQEALIKKINSSGADILFVGLGSPKQEKWISQHKKDLKVKLCMGVGGSLDVLAGLIPAAPLWLQYLGIEWLYRLIREPSRFKRQLVLPKYVFLILRKKYLS